MGYGNFPFHANNDRLQVMTNSKCLGAVVLYGLCRHKMDQGGPSTRPEEVVSLWTSRVTSSGRQETCEYHMK